MKKLGIILVGLLIWGGISAQQPVIDTTLNVPDSANIQQIFEKSNLDPREAILLQKLNAEQLVKLEQQRLNNLLERERDMPIPPFAIVLICLAPFAMVVLIVFFENKSKRAKRQQSYDLYMKSMELGQPLPEKMFEEPEKRNSSRLQNSLVWLGVGIAMIIMALVLNEEFLYTGLIPAFVGLGILIAYFIEKPKKEETPEIDE